MKNSVDLVKQVATIEGAFVLKPPNRIEQNRQPVPVDLQPTVGVAVTLRREDAEVYKVPKLLFQWELKADSLDYQNEVSIMRHQSL